MRANELRPYQEEAIAAVDRDHEQHRAVLIVMATGTGKTTVFSQIIRRRLMGEAPAFPPCRALVVAHRQELIEQAARRVAAESDLGLLDIGVEMGTERGADHHLVVVASVQSLHQKRLERYGHHDFGLIVVDEAHHATADGYRRVLKHFPHAKVLGVTATPDRGDGAGLGHVFERISYSYQLGQAIRDGYLCPVTARQIIVEGVDLDRVRTTAGDLNEGDLEAELITDNAVVGFAVPCLEQAGERPTLVFGVTVRHAKALAAALNARRPGSARCVHGSTPQDERAQILRDYQDGRFQFLTNVGVLTEGVDLPLTACVAMCRPTKSRALYTQCAGRGTRLYPGKDNLLILDFVGNTGRHKLVGALDLLGDGLPAKLSMRAKKRYEEGEDLAEIIADEQRIDAADAERRRLELEEKARRAQVRYTVRPVYDQLSILGLAGKPISAPASTAQAITPRQLEYLKDRVGYKGAEKLDRHAAEAIINAVAARNARGLCTLKQARLLSSHGLRLDVTREEASTIITALKGADWRVTPELRAAWGAAPLSEAAP